MTRPRAALLALVLLAPIPLLGAATAMVWFPESAAAKALFALAKVLLMLAPLAWLLKVDKTKPGLPRWHGDPASDLRGFRGFRRFRQSGMLAAHLTGGAIFLAIAVAYYGFAQHWIDVGPMREKIVQMGLDNLWLYLAGALYWCTINSLLEEYFWRWFIFSCLRDVLPKSTFGITTAIVLCALLFTAHHVVALSVYFDWTTTLLASAGVFIGGTTWSLLYLRYRNIWACYVSHVYPDVIIFFIGYQLIFTAPGISPAPGT
ncbi:MAG: CPBP family intramembrane glutamic endopeptidase [Planctomycetota bacterium]